MTDIVERLRKITSADMAFYQIDAERREAADEIERLQDALRTCRELREGDLATIRKLRGNR